MIRTLDMLLFTMTLVSAQAAVAKGEEEASLQEVLKNPMLLARVLLIQDRCAPLFRLMVDEPSLLVEMDRLVALAKEAAVQGDRANAVTKFIDDHEPQFGVNKLTKDQVAFLQRFAYQPPLFYERGGGQAVAHPGPFIHLAGDLSFRDASGPTMDDFVRDLKNVNSESITAAVHHCSEAKSAEIAQGAVDSLLATEDITSRFEQLMLLLSISSREPGGTPLTAALTDAIAVKLGALVAGLAEDQHTDVLVWVLMCLDAHERPLPDGTASLFTFTGPSSISRLPRHTYGPTGSSVVVDWLLTYYEQNPIDSLGPMGELLPFAGKPIVAERLHEFGEVVTRDLLADPDSTRRDQRLHLLINNIPDGPEQLAPAVLAALPNADVWAWAAATVDANLSGLPWNSGKLREALTDWVSEAPDQTQLLARLRYAVGKLEPVAAGLWQRLLRERSDDLLSVLDALGADASLATLLMPSDVATVLYRRRVALIVVSADEQEAVRLCGVLDPAVWLWSSVDRRLAREALTPIARKRARRAQLNAIARPFWLVWGGTAAQQERPAP